MKKQLLLFLAIAFLGLTSKAQNKLLPTFLSKINHTSFQQSGLMYKTGSVYKPGKQIKYSWNINSSVWTPQDTIINTYNSSGNVIATLTYHGNPVPDKLIYVYNSNGKETSDTSYSWNGTSYYASQYSAYTYDANGNITKKINQSWNNTIWQNNYEDDYLYDANNNQTEYLENTGWNGTSWNNGYKTDYTLSNGQIIGQIDQNYSGSTWVNSSKTDFTYTSGKISGITWYDWNGTSWKNSGNLINVVWYSWVGNMLSEKNKIASYIEQAPNGAGWKDTLQYTTTYDSYGNPTDWLRQAKPAASWITSQEQKDTYLYDANNNITQDIEQDWVDATVGLRNNSKRVYSNYNSYSTGMLNIDDVSGNFVVYPNPSIGIIHIQTTNGQSSTANECKIDIYNLVGEKVYSTTNHTTIAIGTQTSNEIDLSSKPKGIYFIQITDGNNVVNKKIVVQ